MLEELREQLYKANFKYGLYIGLFLGFITTATIGTVALLIFL